MNDSQIPTISLLIRFSTAIQFLTRIPVKGAMGASETFYAEALRRSVVFFPLVGALIGSYTAAVYLTSLTFLSPWLAAFIAVGLEVLLTGAFHEDAFADTADALGGGWTREQVLTIMKDSRLGTYGTIALVIGVGARIAAIAELQTAGITWAALSVIAASTLGRIAIVAMMATTSPIADRASQARDVSGTQSGRTLLVSVLITSPIWGGWVWFSPLIACITLVVALVVVLWFRAKILNRVGGTTGDLLGSTAFLVQLLVLLGSNLHRAA